MDEQLWCFGIPKTHQNTVRPKPGTSVAFTKTPSPPPSTSPSQEAFAIEKSKFSSREAIRRKNSMDENGIIDLDKDNYVI